MPCEGAVCGVVWCRGLLWVCVCVCWCLCLCVLLVWVLVCVWCVHVVIVLVSVSGVGVRVCGVCVCCCVLVFVCVVVCVCVLLCVCDCVSVVAVWRAEKPVCAFKTLPCVHSKRPCVYWQYVPMYKTCGRGTGTHGEVLNVHTGTF